MSIQAIALIANILLAVTKAVVGIAANSRSLIADSFNSTGDVFATTVAWLAFRMGARPADDNHHYGHGNAEALAGLLIGGMICGTGVIVAFDALLAPANDQVPGVAAVWVALGTAATKLVLYQVSIRAGRRLRSPTLIASAKDHIADVAAGLGALAGILLERAGVPSADAWTAVLIGGWVFVQGIEPVRSNISILMQEASPELTATAYKLAAETEGVLHVQEVRTQPIGGDFRLDLTIEVDGTLSVSAGHDVAEMVAQAISTHQEGIVDVHVHVEPRNATPLEIP